MRGTFTTTADFLGRADPAVAGEAASGEPGPAFGAFGSAVVFAAAACLAESAFLAAGFLAGVDFSAAVFFAPGFRAAGFAAFASTTCSSFDLLSGAFATLDHPDFRPVSEDLLTRSTSLAGLRVDEHYI